jgi:hypothetical protein
LFGGMRRCRGDNSSFGSYHEEPRRSELLLAANRSDSSNYSASRQELTGRGISPLDQRCKLKSSYLPFVLRSGRVSSKDPTHLLIDHFALAPPLFKRMLKLFGHEISPIRKHYRRFAGFGSPRCHPTRLARSFPQPFSMPRANAEMSLGSVAAKTNVCFWGKTGPHLLILRFSGFDPNRTSQLRQDAMASRPFWLDRKGDASGCSGWRI